MSRARSRLLVLLALLPVTVAASALLYMEGMRHLEGRPRDFWTSVEWAAETLTTTGYGFDSHWSHPAMVLLVVVLQFAGVLLVFLIFPIYLIPFLEERFEARLPRQAPAAPGRVVIYRWGPAVATFVAEVEAKGVPTLVLEEDEAEARRLVDRGQRVIYGRLEDGALAAAGLADARALIANGSDDANAAVILAARQLGFAGPIFALVEEPQHRKPMTLAGATAVFTPRHILGAALAARASPRISPRLAGVQQLGQRLELSEVRIQPHSRLVGQTLGQAAIGAETGATVIGQWVRGDLQAPPTADTRLEANGILVVAGSHESIEQVAELCGAGSLALRQQAAFVVAGYGEVGRKVVELLRTVGEDVRTIDRTAAEGVDVVGDMLDPKILELAGVDRARAVILALDTDSATLFATVIVKDFAPEVPVIARVNRAENVERIHRAGVDFALSISQVSGQMLARRLLGEEAVSLDPQLKVLRVPAAPLTGRHPAELGIRERTGCSVVAVERGEEVLVELGADFRFAPGDVVYVCGSSEAVRRFEETFPAAAGREG